MDSGLDLVLPEKEAEENNTEGTEIEKEPASESANCSESDTQTSKEEETQETVDEKGDAVVE